MTKEDDIGNLLEAYVQARVRASISERQKDVEAASGWKAAADARRELLFVAISAKRPSATGTAAARTADDERHAQQTER